MLAKVTRAILTDAALTLKFVGHNMMDGAALDGVGHGHDRVLSAILGSPRRSTTGTTTDSLSCDQARLIQLHQSDARILTSPTSVLGPTLPVARR